ncbi:MAG: hypothetical protein V4463_11705 [Pseudomonadota bacterium]
MTNSTYLASLRELYEGEIFGEALALALLAVARNDDDRYAFGTLLQLETETKARLRPLLAAYGISLDESADLASIAPIVGAYQSSSNIGQFVAAVKPAIAHFVARYEEIVRLGPAADRSILESMVRHEAAILNWFDLAEHGGTQAALGAMIEQLHYPLPCPQAPA